MHGYVKGCMDKMKDAWHDEGCMDMLKDARIRERMRGQDEGYTDT
jgi:hypothetical protein